MILFCQAHTYFRAFSFGYTLAFESAATSASLTITLLVSWRTLLLAILFIATMLFLLETVFLIAEFNANFDRAIKTEQLDRAIQISSDESLMTLFWLLPAALRFGAKQAAISPFWVYNEPRKSAVKAPFWFCNDLRFPGREYPRQKRHTCFQMALY